MDRGYIALINDSLVRRIVITSSLVGGVLSSGMAIFLSNELHQHTFDSGVHWYFGTFGFLVGCAVSYAVLETVESSVTCLFVCMAEEERLMETRIPKFVEAVNTHKIALYTTHDDDGGGEHSGVV